MSKKNILIIDDDFELAELLKEFIESEGFIASHKSDGAEGLRSALDPTIDLVILDIMLPSQSGLEVLKQIRSQSLVPVLMLTAKGDDTDRILGLELGADDYVPKPAPAREILARIKAILRRTEARIHNQAQNNQTIQIGQLTIDSATRTAKVGQAKLELTSTEFNCLELLAKHVGNVVSKDMLSKEVLGRPLQRFDHSIEVHISRVRDKLTSASTNVPRIETIYRQGYQLIKEAK